MGNEAIIMKVGDLVTHKYQKGVGLILKTPEETGNGDFLVKYPYRDARYLHEIAMKVVSSASW